MKSDWSIYSQLNNLLIIGPHYQLIIAINLLTHTLNEHPPHEWTTKFMVKNWSYHQSKQANAILINLKPENLIYCDSRIYRMVLTHRFSVCLSLSVWLSDSLSLSLNLSHSLTYSHLSQQFLLFPLTAKWVSIKVKEKSVNPR